jgi:predicted transglutaminase-like cysteine proteinase
MLAVRADMELLVGPSKRNSPPTPRSDLPASPFRQDAAFTARLSASARHVLCPNASPFCNRSPTACTWKRHKRDCVRLAKHAAENQKTTRLEKEDHITYGSRQQWAQGGCALPT